MDALFGKKRFTKFLGYAANYCGVCRRIAEFRIDEVMMAPHIYFMYVGGGTSVGHMQTCSSCQMESDVYLSCFESISKKRITPVEELAFVTFPTVYKVFRTQLERQERIRTDSETCNKAERHKEFMRIFSTASVYFQQHQQRTGIRVLINGLHALTPTEEELRECLSHYRDGRHLIGLLRSADLLRMIQRKEFSTDPY